DSVVPDRASRGLRVRDCGRLVALLMPLTVFGKRSDLPVVAFQRIKVRIRGPDHIFARSSLLGRDIIDECRTRTGQEWDCCFADIPIVELFDFLNLSAINFQPYGNKGVTALDLQPSLESNLPKHGVGHIYFEARGLHARTPEYAFADLYSRRV